MNAASACRDDIRKNPVLAMVGNPNSGKSTLFNALTGSHQKVGNWPGVTVEKKTGHFCHGETCFDVVDLPGTYSLHVSHEDDSLDQRIAQHFILEGSADLLINIIDATSLERGLYLTTQLLDAGIPMVVALNMMDVADSRGLHIDPYSLGEQLGMPVVPIVASRSEGIGTLVDVIINKVYAEEACPRPAGLGEPVESAISEVLATIHQNQPGSARKLPASMRLLAAAVLERDASVLGLFPDVTRHRLLEIVSELENDLVCSASDQLITSRYRWIAGRIKSSVHQDERKRKSFTEWLDALLLNRLLAFPLFLGVMYLMFLFTINFGSAFIDFFDITAGVLFVEIPRQALTAVHCPGWIIALVADGAGGGVQLVASFIPVIGTLFLFQSFLESSGYMARAAFILDRMMRSIGLPGKSFVPLVVGFGCNVPSVMAARTLDSQKDRLLTTLMAPFMSCGARLTVYVLFATAFFPTSGQNVVFALYLIGLALAVGTGYLVRNRLLNRDMTPFIMELPNYHIPTLRNLMLSTWHRLRGFILRAGKAIVLVVIVLNFFNSIGTDGSFGNQDSEKSVLSAIGMEITPLFGPMGVREENWPATVGIFSGIFAKEVVVGTLDALYSNLAASADAQQLDEAPGLWQMFLAGVATVPDNLRGLADSLADPLGLAVGDLTDRQLAAEQQAVSVSTITLMGELFDGRIGAFAYVLFVLLYMPCVATLGAIYKEAGRFWAIFSASWNTLIAYGSAVVCYQLGTLASHPVSSMAWIGAATLLMAGGYLSLMKLAEKEVSRDGNLIPVVNL